MHDLRLSAHRAQAGIWRPHFRFALAQAVQAFDSDRNDITKVWLPSNFLAGLLGLFCLVRKSR